MPGSTTLRVLIIDDSADDAVLIARTLRRSGIDAHCLRVDHRDALRSALADPCGWDLIVCDFSMPGFDAGEAVGLARDALPAVPIVLACGRYPHGLWHELGSGFVRQFVCKDELSDLAAVVRTLVARAAEPDPCPRGAVGGGALRRARHTSARR